MSETRDIAFLPYDRC